MKELNVKKWTKGNLTRYYLTGAGDLSFGYVQEISVGLGGSYYDAHRAAKGETTKEVVTHTVVDPEVLKAISLAALDGELIPSTPLLNKHSGTYGVVRGKRKAIWINAAPIEYN